VTLADGLFAAIMVLVAAIRRQIPKWMRP